MMLEHPAVIISTPGISAPGISAFGIRNAQRISRDAGFLIMLLLTMAPLTL